MHAAKRISARLAPTGSVCARHEAVLSQLHAHPQAALKRWAQKAHLASPHSAASPGGPSNRGAGGQADGERQRVDEPLPAALLGRPGPAEQHGRLRSSAASSSLRTASISRECCFPTASRLIHGISILSYNVHCVLEHS